MENNKPQQMNQPYLYDPKANVLRQRADMEKPKEHPADYSEHTNLYQYWYREWTAYNAHLASLPAYTPVSGWVPEVGKEYYEGKDFEVIFGEEIAIPIDIPKCYCRTAVQAHYCEEKCTAYYDVNKSSNLTLAFTIEDMMKAYDAGCGDVNGTEKEKYFKSLGI